MAGHRLSLVWSLVALTLLSSVFVVARRRCRDERMQDPDQDRLWRAKIPCGSTGYRSANGNTTRDHHHHQQHLRIKGGVKLHENERKKFPSYVSVKIEAGGKDHSCSGVLIDEDVVLTAAQCLDFSSITDITVSPSFVPSIEWKYRPPVFLVGADRACRVLDWKKDGSSFDYDWGILKLSSPLPISENISPACFGSDFKHGQQAYVVGQGLVDVAQGGVDRRHGAMRGPFYPSAAAYLAVERVKCPHDEKVHKSAFCTESSDDTHQGGTCKGDSGGPVLLKDPALGGKWAVVGLASTFDKECKTGMTTMVNADLSYGWNTLVIWRRIWSCLNNREGMVYERRYVA